MLELWMVFIFTIFGIQQFIFAVDQFQISTASDNGQMFRFFSCAFAILFAAWLLIAIMGYGMEFNISWPETEGV